MQVLVKVARASNGPWDAAMPQFYNEGYLRGWLSASPWACESDARVVTLESAREDYGVHLKLPSGWAAVWEWVTS